MEVSIWAVALVVRDEARVAIAFGFALDVIALCKGRVEDLEVEAVEAITCCVSCDRVGLTCALWFIGRAYNRFTQLPNYVSLA